MFKKEKMVDFSMTEVMIQLIGGLGLFLYWRVVYISFFTFPGIARTFMSDGMKFNLKVTEGTLSFSLYEQGELSTWGIKAQEAVMAILSEKNQSVHSKTESEQNSTD